ncbi:MAG: DUF1259 domain-containing protein [Chloroflexi bacterium]|nr:DUF1259 domain-containing protein [Chloroflexota bacterium]
MELRKLALSTVILLSLPQIAAATPPMGTIVSGILGREGKMTANAYVVPIPRSDLKESIGGFPLPTGFGFGGWVAFMRHGSSTMVMGDLPLKPSEIDAVIRTLDARGVHVTGLHNHFLGESEPIMFMHVEGMGSAGSLAEAIRAGLATTSAPIPKKPAAPPTSGLNNSAIEQIVGLKGVVPGPKVFKIVIGRPELHITDMGVAMTTPLVNSWAAFTGSDDDAAVAGDMAMQASEIGPVVHALETHGLQIFAIHNHMSTEHPRIFFLHYYGRGPAARLAEGFRAAIAQLHGKITSRGGY